MYSNHDPLREEMFDVFKLATQIESIKDDVLQRICFPYQFNEEWQTKINILFPKEEMRLDNAIWVEEYSLYFVINNVNVTNLNELNGDLSGGFKGQDVGSIRYYQQVFNLYLMFFGLDAKNTLQTNRNEWSKSFGNDFLNNKFLHELCRHILENYKNQLKNILKEDSLVELFDFCFTSDKSKTLWKNIKLFDISKWEDYKYKNLRCKIYDKSFIELLKLKSFNFYHIDGFLSPDFDRSKLSKNDLVYPSGFNSWFKRIFDQEWIDAGGFIFHEKVKGGEIIRYKKEKYEGVDEKELRIINKIKFSIQSNRKRINFNQEWLDTEFFKEFAPLFTKSILVERLVGLENLNVNHLILPFYILSKNIDVGPTIKVDYLNDNELVKHTWEERDEEYQNLSFEDFLKLYNKLEEKIKRLVDVLYPDWIPK